MSSAIVYGFERADIFIFALRKLFLFFVPFYFVSSLFIPIYLVFSILFI
jgi:hypothetical protein